MYVTPLVFGFAPYPIKDTRPQAYRLEPTNIAFKLVGYIPIIGTISSLAIALLVCCKSKDNTAKCAFLIRASLTLLPIALLLADLAVTYLQHQHIKRQQNPYTRHVAS